MKAVLVLIALALCETVAMADNELPDELYLRCKLKSTKSVTIGAKNTFSVEAAVKDLHLRDGTFGPTSDDVPLGSDCKLFDGKISCKFKRTAQMKSEEAGPRVQKRESFVLLNRRTGEIRLQTKLSNYDGEVAEGSPRLTEVSNEHGVCQTISKPPL
jgi:hypothetical protein